MADANPTQQPPVITIYTDGSSRGNPGPGGFGIVLMCGQYRKDVACGFRRTTNNRMELLGVITALEMLKIPNSIVTLYTDSKYVSDAVNQNWLAGWVKKNFKNVKNPDLWVRFIRIYKQHKVKFVWVKGHADNQYNNRCDQLAVAAATGEKLLVDEYFEANENDNTLQL
ncbi:MAG: ribonuclease HI [Bacteroidales bacterium]|nr:ribonuclease HI [Bacteroidales bacterium]